MIRKYTEELSEKYRVVFVLSARGRAVERGDGQDPRAHRSSHQIRLAPAVFSCASNSPAICRRKADEAMNCKELAYMLAD